MKIVCVKCNRPLEHHPKVTQELVDATRAASFTIPIMGHRAPISDKCIGQFIGHDPVMVEPKWETPFGTTETPLPVNA